MLLYAQSLARVCSRMLSVYASIRVLPHALRKSIRSRMHAHTLAYASMRVWPHALRKTRIVTATHRCRIMLSMHRAATELQQSCNSDDDSQTQNYAKHATELQQSCNRAATVTATHRRRIMLSMQQSCNRAATVTATHRRRISRTSERVD
jgi:hypothetical protein